MSLPTTVARRLLAAFLVFCLHEISALPNDQVLPLNDTNAAIEVPNSVWLGHGYNILYASPFEGSLDTGLTMANAVINLTYTKGQTQNVNGTFYPQHEIRRNMHTNKRVASLNHHTIVCLTTKRYDEHIHFNVIDMGCDRSFSTAPTQH